MDTYERMFKLTSDTASGEKMAIIYTAALNLLTVDEIRDFAKSYNLYYPHKIHYDIPYILSFFEIETRALWIEAIGDIVNIHKNYTRSEQKLARYYTCVDENGNLLPVHVNKEKGMHQSK